jgi:hypothetical protein
MLKNLPTAILLYFIGLISFYTESTGAAIGLVVSALLFSFNHYIETVKNPHILKKFEEAEARLAHDYNQELDKLKQETEKLSLSLAKMPSVQKTDKPRQSIQF